MIIANYKINQNSKFEKCKQYYLYAFYHYCKMYGHMNIKTKQIFDKINAQYGFAGEPILSMGMSESFEIAIEEGANLVRIGRRLFEKR